MGWAVADRRRAVRAQVVRLVQERKREKIARVAAELGYSYHYFRYSVLPELLAAVVCLERDGDELVWACDDEEKA